MKRFITALLMLLALSLVLCTAEETGTAQDITDKCTVTASSGKVSKLLDGGITSYWEAGSNGAYLTIELPADETPGGLQVEWFSEPTTYELTQYDAQGLLLKSETESDYFRCICLYYELEPGAASVRLTVAANSKIARIHVYSAGTLPDDVQVWQPSVTKADIMLISTHQDDELLWFGGAIPYYNTVRENKMVVMYMTTCGRRRRMEALNGLWVMGVRTYPEFLNLKDEYVKSMDEGIALWGGRDHIIELIVEQIRRYRPEVVLVQDINGEYSHRQHRITSQLTYFAVIAAADPTQYADSYNEYGAWEVKKLYRHLGKENIIYMDWNEPSEKLGGLTPLESADLGFKQHVSQQNAYNMEEWGNKYDNTKFSLVYSTVGEDVYKDDFLENTPADPRRLSAEAATEVTAEPSAEPEPEDRAENTPEPSAEPTSEATQEPAVPESGGKSGPGAWPFILGGAVILGAGAWGLHVKRENERRKRRRRRAAMARRRAAAKNNNVRTQQNHSGGNRNVKPHRDL